MRPEGRFVTALGPQWFQRTVAVVACSRVRTNWIVAIGMWTIGAAVVVLVPTAIHGWGAPQLGPVATWVFGGVTLAALALAFLESRRSIDESLKAEARTDRQRRIDHEIERRRECIKAASDMWAAIVAQQVNVTRYFAKFEDLVNRPNDNMAIALEMATDLMDEAFEFQKEWTRSIEGSLGYALIVCSHSPIDNDVREVARKLKGLTGALTAAAGEMAAGRGANVAGLEEAWNSIVRLRQPFTDTMREKLALDWEAVGKAVDQFPSADRPQ